MLWYHTLDLIDAVRHITVKTPLRGLERAGSCIAGAASVDRRALGGVREKESVLGSGSFLRRRLLGGRFPHAGLLGCDGLCDGDGGLGFGDAAGLGLAEDDWGLVFNGGSL